MSSITSRRIGIKKKSQKMLITGLIVFLMVLSVVGYAAYQWEEGESYNGYNFDFRNDYWTTKIGKVLFEFHSLPRDVEDIKLLGNLRYDEYFLVHDSSINLSEREASAIDLVKYELNIQMTEKLGIPVKIAISNPTNISTAISCADATSFLGVIEYSYGNETQIINENNCIKVTADSDLKLIKANDRLLYGLLEII